MNMIHLRWPIKDLRISFHFPKAARCLIVWWLNYPRIFCGIQIQTWWCGDVKISTSQWSDHILSSHPFPGFQCIPISNTSSFSWPSTPFMGLLLPNLFPHFSSYPSHEPCFSPPQPLSTPQRSAVFLMSTVSFLLGLNCFHQHEQLLFQSCTAGCLWYSGIDLIVAPWWFGCISSFTHASTPLSVCSLCWLLNYKLLGLWLILSLL